MTYWPDDDKRTPLERLLERDAVKIDTQASYSLFDGCRGHKVESFRGGDRYSLVFFSISTWKQGPKEQMPEGTVYPTESSLKYFSDMLAPARGGNGSILAAFGMKVKPQVLFWPRQNLIHLPRKLLLQVADYAEGSKALSNVSRLFTELYTGMKKSAR